MTDVVVDPQRCQGYANCLVESELFDLDDDNRAVFLGSDRSAAARTEIENAVRACPTAALQVTGT